MHTIQRESWLCLSVCVVLCATYRDADSGSAAVFDEGCAEFEISVSGTDRITVATVGRARCGPVVPVIQGTPTYNHETQRIHLPIALRNAGPNVYKRPVWLLAWPDSVEADVSVPRDLLPSLRGHDYIPWAKAPSALIWSFDTLLAPSSELLQRLDPGTTSRPRSLEVFLLVPPDQGKVTRFRVLFRTRAGRIDPTVSAAPPRPITNAVWREIYSNGTRAKGPGAYDIASLNLLEVAFKAAATQQERQAAVGLVGGEVLGGHRVGADGYYYVRLPGTGKRLSHAIRRLNAVPQVQSAVTNVNWIDVYDSFTLGRATVFDEGCTEVEIMLSSMDGITVMPVPQASCGPVVPVIQGTPTFNHQSGRIQLPVALKNEGMEVYKPPVWLAAWPDSIEATDPALPPARAVTMRGYDQVQSANASVLGGALLWSYDVMMAPSLELLPRLDPGATSRARTVELLVPSTVTRLRVRLRTRAGQIERTVRPTPPISIAPDIWRALYASANMVKGPGNTDIAPHDLLEIAFRPTATQEERQTAVRRIGGEVLGGRGAGPGGYYYVRIAGTGTMAGLLNAIRELKTLPQVDSVAIGVNQPDPDYTLPDWAAPSTMTPPLPEPSQPVAVAGSMVRVERPPGLSRDQLFAQFEKRCFGRFIEAPGLPPEALHAAGTARSSGGDLIRLAASGRLDYGIDPGFGLSPPCWPLQLVLRLRPAGPGHRLPALNLDSVWIRRGTHQFAVLAVQTGRDPIDTDTLITRRVEGLRLVTGPIDVFVRIGAPYRRWLAIRRLSLKCLPPSDLILNDIELGASSADVRRRLGSPVHERESLSHDEGGVYRLVQLQYHDLLVDVGHDRVELLETASQKFVLQSGIRVGATIEDVGGRVGLAFNRAEYLNADTLTAAVCEGSRHNPDLSGLSLIFELAPHDSTLRLRKIRLFERRQ